MRVAEGCGAEGLFCTWLEGRGGKRCDRSRMAPWRSRSLVSTGELANCECRRCTEEKSSSILSPRAETAWMVDRRNGSMFASPEERVSHSFGKRQGICVESSWMRSRVRSIRADRKRASLETPAVEEEADGRAGNCPNKGGGGGQPGTWPGHRDARPKRGRKSGVGGDGAPSHLVFVKLRGRKIEGAEHAILLAPFFFFFFFFLL